MLAYTRLCDNHILDGMTGTSLAFNHMGSLFSDCCGAMRPCNKSLHESSSDLDNSSLAHIRGKQICAKGSHPILCAPTCYNAYVGKRIISSNVYHGTDVQIGCRMRLTLYWSSQSEEAPGEQPHPPHPSTTEVAHAQQP